MHIAWMSYKQYRTFIANVCRIWGDSEFRPDWLICEMTRKQRRRIKAVK